MKKSLLAALLLALFLCGCGGGSSKADYALTDASVLLEAGAFSGSDMAPVNATLVPMLYHLEADTIEDCVCYMATNTSVSADEVLVLLLTDEAAAIAAEQACRDRVASQIDVCQSYAPAAVPRLEQALISRRGNTVLLVVGDPDVLAGLTQLQ